MFLKELDSIVQISKVPIEASLLRHLVVLAFMLFFVFLRRLCPALVQGRVFQCVLRRRSYLSVNFFEQRRRYLGSATIKHFGSALLLLFGLRSRGSGALCHCNSQGTPSSTPLALLASAKGIWRALGVLLCRNFLPCLGSEVANDGVGHLSVSRVDGRLVKICKRTSSISASHLVLLSRSRLGKIL